MAIKTKYENFKLSTIKTLLGLVISGKGEKTE